MYVPKKLVKKPEAVILFILVMGIVCGCRNSVVTTQEPVTDSGIVFQNLSPKEVDRLYVLGKVWGFVKYHHPTIAQGELNWDNKLLQIMPAIQGRHFAKRVAAWVPPVPPGNEMRPELSTKQEIKLRPDTEWIRSVDLLGEAVSQSLSTVQNTLPPDKHHYVDFVSGVGNPIFQNEEPYLDMKWTDDGLKLLALFRYWNMIEYFFPYRHLIDEDWDDILKDFIPRMVEADDELSYKLTLLELVSKIQDTHAGIREDTTLFRFGGQRMVPLQINFVEDQATVVRKFDYLDSRARIDIGDVILAVDGKPIDTLVQKKSRYTPASNRSAQLRNIAFGLLRTDQKHLSITFRNELDTFQEEIATINLRKQRINFWKHKSSHQELGDDIGYIYPGSLKKGEIDVIMPLFTDKKGIIVDLRCYPSDFIVYSLGKYLMPTPTPFASFTVGSSAHPGQFYFANTLKVGEHNPDYYKGKVVILTNETTLSQAEYTTMALRVAPRATVVGSTTAGADGNVSSITLPGNVRTSISGIGVYYPDGTETQRVGIVPDIELRPTVQGIREGRDELLERAVRLINE